MVHVDSKFVRSNNINFESDPNFNEDCRVNYSSQEDFNRQFAMMKQASEVLSVFTRLPCALEACFGSTEGVLLSKGVICPFTLKSLIMARNIWPSLHFISWKFSRLYPSSRFVFFLEQKVTFEYVE